MSNPCGACDPFVEESERLFAKTLKQYGFRRVACDAQREGRECQAMYEATVGRMMLFLSDGSANCCLGSHSATFTPYIGASNDGDEGWYHIVTLADVDAGKPTVTHALLNRFLDGRVSYYEWQADLLAERSDRLFALVAAANEQRLAAQVAQLVREREAQGRV